MKNLFRMFCIVAVTIFLTNCGGKGSGVEKSKEMDGFCSAMNNTSDGTAAALKKYGAAGLETHDMEMYGLSEPNVTAATGPCYTVEFKAGVTTRTYDVCWEGGKINKIVDKGMK
jgi:hypothetical protein